MQSAKYLGIDGSKATPDVGSWPATAPEQFTNTDIGKLLEWPQEQVIERLIIEATDGFETTLAAAH